jgi:hypothetical protein
MVPETMGCDVLIFAGKHKIGVQRKEVKDLLASVDDGRLAMQLAQMQGAPLDLRVVLVEGQMRWSGSGLDAVLDGGWTGRGSRVWTRQQMLGIEWSVRARGADWVQTGGLDETLAWVQYAEDWWRRGEHRGLTRRPAAPTAWGTAQSWEWAAWVLQGFPGVGSELAKRIVRQFGGLPLKWTVSAEELAQVQGISEKRAHKWVRELNGEATDDR